MFLLIDHETDCNLSQVSALFFSKLSTRANNKVLNMNSSLMNHTDSL